ncbi:MAG: hypothetical protein EBT19_05760, partial [Methylocystaceae bacterium]|nr:hypothetical protein [Methylocystaceae bacterium]
APIGATRERVEEALYRLMAHHDALRLRVVGDEEARDDFGGAKDQARGSFNSGEIAGPDTEILADRVTPWQCSLWLDPVGERLSLETLDVSGLSREASEEQVG